MAQQPTAARRYRYRHLEVKTRQAPTPRNPMAWRAGVVLSCFLAIGLSYVYLTSKTEGVERELRKKQKHYSDECKVLDNVRMELESYQSGKYIQDQVQARNLGLHQPFPGQVRRVSLDMRVNRAEFSEEGLISGLPEDLAQGGPALAEPRKLAQ